jgi:hypothetical protein
LVAANKVREDLRCRDMIFGRAGQGRMRRGDGRGVILRLWFVANPCRAWRANSTASVAT